MEIDMCHLKDDMHLVIQNNFRIFNLWKIDTFEI